MVEKSEYNGITYLSFWSIGPLSKETSVKRFLSKCIHGFTFFGASLVLTLSLFSAGCTDGKQSEIETLKAQMDQLQRDISAVKRSTAPMGSSDGIVEVVKNIIPGVVAIHSEKVIEQSAMQYLNPFEELFGDPYGQQNTPRQPPSQQKQQGLGSGVIISSEGYILTNHHVAGDADELKVTLSDERTYEAELVGTDKLSDVAVIKLKNPPKDLPVIPLGNSDEVRIGETVLAVGSPFGYSNTVTKGIISARGRQVGLNSYESYLQTDASINPGNSGGALVDLKGELIGINTAIASRTGSSNGIGFAIPINMAKNIYQQLVKSGSVTRGYLGVFLQEIDDNLVEALKLKDKHGALISKVIEDSPAQKAGLKETDVLLAIDDVRVKDVNELRNNVAMLAPGKEYTFVFLRDGKEQKTKIKIGERDADQVVGGSTEPEKQKEIGLSLTEIDQRLAYQYRLNRTDGIMVTEVKPGTPADKAGFEAGDIILQVGKEKTAKLSDWIKALKSAKKSTVMVLVERRGGNLFIALKVP